MILTEMVKSFLSAPEDPNKTQSSTVQQDKVLNDLDNDSQTVGSFFDSDSSVGGLFGNNSESDTLFKQKEKIQKYRQLSMIPDVTDAIEEIVNEIIFTYDGTQPVKIDIDEENEKLKEAVDKRFQRLINLMGIERNFFHIVKQGYVDGQMVMHCAYDQKNTKGGIQSIKMIDPVMFHFDAKNQVWEYVSEDRASMMIDGNDGLKYSPEEIVREDFGLYDGKINLGYLEHAIKPANMLKTLEDLLVPLRFSRSISRRVFNVDIGDLPTKRGAEVMRDYQNKFKYKKFYNNDTGEVSNQQHITSMVEDYWFANRSGGKGTAVDLLDETGNLGELDDILYFARKLYRALKIPSNRISLDPKNDGAEFDYDTTRVSKEDIKFFMFISRIRRVYSAMLKEMLKRDIIATGTMSETEWFDKSHLINITFTNENSFIEKLNLENFMSKLDIYRNASEHQGKILSVETIMRDIFRMDEEAIKEELKQIKKEEKDPLYSNLYQDDGF